MNQNLPPSSNTPETSQLGKNSVYVDQYDPTLLFPIARLAARQNIGIMGALPFTGADLWTGYELSWLNAKGKPQVALLHMTIPCESPYIVESKSLKLYLNSFNNSRFHSAEAVRQRIVADVGRAVWQGKVDATTHDYDAQKQPPKLPPNIGVRLVLPEQFALQRVADLEGICLDRLDIECSEYQPAPQLLQTVPDEPNVSETLTSNLLRSNCPVTGQPDWGSIQIQYTGAPIRQESLLRYIVSFRNHNGFHEHCVETIFTDIMQRCQPDQLTVYARYTRRGGLDINPLRTNAAQAFPNNFRTARQ